MIILITLLYVAIAMGRVVQSRTKSKVKEILDSITGGAEVFSAAAELGTDMVKDGVQQRAVAVGQIAGDVLMDTASIGLKTTGNLVNKVILGKDMDN